MRRRIGYSKPLGPGTDRGWFRSGCEKGETGGGAELYPCELVVMIYKKIKVILASVTEWLEMLKPACSDVISPHQT